MNKRIDDKIQERAGIFYTVVFALLAAGILYACDGTLNEIDAYECNHYTSPQQPSYCAELFKAHPELKE